MKKVLIATKLDGVARDILRASGHYEVVQDGETELAVLAANHPDAYALIVRGEKVAPQIIDAMPALKVIVRAGSGFNTIDVRHARRKGIDVMNTPGANANAVAEEVIAMMLADARHVVGSDASTRAGKWEKDRFMGRELAGKTVGIVGMGNVGRMVAKRLSGFDVRVLAYDPIVSSGKAEELGVALTDLSTLFGESDYITLHVPENEETRNLVDEKMLAHAKQGATIVNCARAGIIDEQALRKARAERGIRFLTDVYSKEGVGRKSVEDVADIMLPHIGASTLEANVNAARRAAEQLIDLDQKGIASFIVNRDIPEGLDQVYCELSYTLAKVCRCLVGKNAAPRLIETTFYGPLREFADWLSVPVVAGICENFDRTMNAAAARAFLRDVGIEYVNREVPAQKKYGSSITVDLTGAIDAGNFRHVSIRGTITEGIMMIARINEFDKLYLEPSGNIVFFLYDDRPGVLGSIGVNLAASGINIEDVRNPHDSKTNRSLATMKVNKPVPDELVDRIRREIDAISAFSVRL